MPTYILSQADFDALAKVPVNAQGAGSGLSGETDYIIVDAVHTFTTDILPLQITATVSGIAQIGQTLTAVFSDGSLDGTWYHGETAQAVTGPTYVLPESADGQVVTCRKGLTLSNGLTITYPAPVISGDIAAVSIDVGDPVSRDIASYITVDQDADLSGVTITPAEGPLPQGLSFDGSILSGTPTQGVDTVLTFVANNSGGEVIVSLPFSVNDGAELDEILDFASASVGLFIDDDTPEKSKNLFKGAQGDTDGFFVHCKVLIPNGVVPSGYIFSTARTSSGADYFGVSTTDTVSRNSGSTSTIAYAGGPVAGQETICTFWVHYPEADPTIDRLTYFMNGVQGTGSIGQASNRTDHNRLAFGYVAGNNSGYANFYIYDLVFGQGNPAGLDAWVNAGNRADLYDFAADPSILAYKAERLQRDSGGPGFDLTQLSIPEWNQRNSPEWIDRTLAVPTAYVDAQPVTLSPKYGNTQLTYRIEQGVKGALSWADVSMDSFTIGGVDASADFDANGNLVTTKTGDVMGSVTIDGVAHTLDGYIGPEIPMIANSPYATRAGGNGVMAAIPAYVPPTASAQPHTSGAEVKALIDAWLASGPTADLILEDGDYSTYNLSLSGSDYGGYAIRGKSMGGLVLGEIRFNDASNLKVRGLRPVSMVCDGAENLDLKHIEFNSFYFRANGSGARTITLDCCFQPDGDVRNAQSKFIYWNNVNTTRCIFADSYSGDNIQVNSRSIAAGGTVYYFDRVVIFRNNEAGATAHPDGMQNVFGLVKGFFGNMGIFDKNDDASKGIQGLFLADCDCRDLTAFRLLAAQSLNTKSLTMNGSQYNCVIRECSLAGTMDLSNKNAIGAYEIDTVLAYEPTGVGTSEDSFSPQTNIVDVSALAADSVWASISTEYGWRQFLPEPAYATHGAGVLIAELLGASA